MAIATIIETTQGDIVEQRDVEVVVNAWNRNIFPWWLLVPQGVSKAIRRAAGNEPFRELATYGLIPLGHAVLTNRGKLPVKGIIHVAGISLFWMASEKSVRLSTRNAIGVARQNGFRSLAMPILGSGTGGLAKDAAMGIMMEEIRASSFPGLVRVVEYLRAKK